MKYSKDAFQKETFQEGWKIWTGLEQEGPFKGYKTLFVGSDCSLKEFEENFHLLDEFDQIYLNPGFINSEIIPVISELEFMGIITIALPFENYAQYKSLLPFVHFMILFPQLNGLDETDTIRIDCGNMVTYSIQVKDMIKTSDKCYLEDTRIL